MGPPPKAAHQRRRRNLPLNRGVPTRLPASGREGPAPRWPLPPHGEPLGRAAEATEWRKVWRKPQAIMWEQLDCVDLVARYVRITCEINRGGLMGMSLMAEIRQIEDRLGLSPMSMLRLGWTVEDEDAVGGAEDRRGKVVDIRERLKAVDGRG